MMSDYDYDERRNRTDDDDDSCDSDDDYEREQLEFALYAEVYHDRQEVVAAASGKEDVEGVQRSFTVHDAVERNGVINLCSEPVHRFCSVSRAEGRYDSGIELSTTDSCNHYGITGAKNIPETLENDVADDILEKVKRIENKVKKKKAIEKRSKANSEEVFEVSKAKEYDLLDSDELELVDESRKPTKKRKMRVERVSVIEIQSESSDNSSCIFIGDDDVKYTSTPDLHIHITGNNVNTYEKYVKKKKFKRKTNDEEDESKVTPKIKKSKKTTEVKLKKQTRKRKSTLDEMDLMELQGMAFDTPQTTHKRRIVEAPTEDVSRYFASNPGVRCHNCNETGHMSKNCPRPKKIVCIYCGCEGHVSRTCPDAVCFRCLYTGHQASDCDGRPYFKRFNCTRCDMYGHGYDNCPEFWRQYHSTISPTFECINRGSQKANKRVYCYNCARKGHLGYECARQSMARHVTPLCPFVSQYDNVSGKKHLRFYDSYDEDDPSQPGTSTPRISKKNKSNSAKLKKNFKKQNQHVPNADRGFTSNLIDPSTSPKKNKKKKKSKKEKDKKVVTEKKVLTEKKAVLKKNSAKNKGNSNDPKNSVVPHKSPKIPKKNKNKASNKSNTSVHNDNPKDVPNTTSKGTKSRKKKSGLRSSDSVILISD